MTTDPREVLGAVRSEIAKAVVGQDQAVTGLIIALLCQGHVLLEGVPGVAKTLLVRSLGTALALLNFGIDEFINPRLRAAGLSRKAARGAGLSRRFRLGLTPVTAQAPEGTDLADTAQDRAIPDTEISL